MRALLNKILEILDGTPAQYGDKKRQSGQSVVELALVTPILIVLIAGLVEIGWFANNYMILLEVTRVGARAGTTMSGSSDIDFWPDYNLSRSPTYPGETATDLGFAAIAAERTNARNCDALAIEAPLAGAVPGFFNLIGCTMLRSLDPLTFDTTNAGQEPNDVDDIVISAFSLASITPDDVPIAYQGDLARRPGLPDAVNHVIVVGRYPMSANECNVNPDGSSMGAGAERDPFDFVTDGVFNQTPSDTFDELEAFDAGNELERGFSWTGHHLVDGNPNCLGSEWSIERVEALMNLPAFLNDPDAVVLGDQRQFVPNQGMVLVEMFWRHELLLKIPVLSPVMDVLGPRSTISVWAAFPLQSTEPNITFD